MTLLCYLQEIFLLLLLTGVSLESSENCITGLFNLIYEKNKLCIHI